MNAEVFVCLVVTALLAGCAPSSETSPISGPITLRDGDWETIISAGSVVLKGPGGVKVTIAAGGVLEGDDARTIERMEPRVVLVGPEDVQQYPAQLALRVNDSEAWVSVNSPAPRSEQDPPTTSLDHPLLRRASGVLSAGTEIRCQLKLKDGGRIAVRLPEADD